MKRRTKYEIICSAMTAEQIIEFDNSILDLIKTNTVSEISRILNIDRRTINNVLEKYNVIKRSRSESIKLSVQNKYGVDNVSQLDSVKNKKVETSREHYGTDSPMQSEEIKEKIKSISREIYGTDYPCQSEEVKSKISKTFFERYEGGHPLRDSSVVSARNANFELKYGKGIINPFQAEEVKLKIKETVKERYGFESVTQSEEIKEKIRNTNQERYGVDCTLKSSEIQKKIMNTCLERYNVPYACMTEQCRNSSGSTISNINLRFSELLRSRGIESELEFPLGKFSYDIHIINTEINDILIEIDPTFTHNSTDLHYGRYTTSSDYHLVKSKFAMDNGFRCIHIFDWDDWNKVIDIIDPDKQRVYARKCNINLISINDVNEFLDKYHLQNTCRNQSIRLGLYYDNELIQIMTFGKPRYNKNYQYELLRLCTRSGFIVIGGAERLFNKFIKDYDPDSIISYCDYSKFDGSVYGRLDMRFDHISNPDVRWSRDNKYITNSYLRMHGFDRIFKTSYGKETSNRELMINHGWREVFDCGQRVYYWRKE